jgi:hypothetical protein
MEKVYMRKNLLVVFFLLFLLVPAKGTYGQNSEEPDLQFGEEPFREGGINTLPPISPAGPGQNIYYTHPEFNGILTTTVTIPAQNTAEGYIFIAPIPQDTSIPAAVMILDNSGEPIYIKTIPDDKFVGDFKKQTVNGTDYLTFHSGIFPGGFTFGTSYVLDDSYQVVDTWTMDIGGGSDVHDFLLLDNGHAILMAYVPIPFDLSPYGGPENGTLVEIVLQEQDANKNVVFEWYGSHHMPIEDTEVNLNTTQAVDFLHTNAVAVDDDGNWLLSHRNFSEITKIDRQTGEIIWRMGGAGNEFTFTNDAGFFKQHDIQRLENGHISLFDNGNQHDPPHSRAVEYAIDEIAKTVTRIWMYPDDASIYASAMGNFQRLSNGNSFIGWGTEPKFTEVEPDGTVALEILMSTSNYRAFRFPWNATPTAAPRAVLQYDGDPTAVTIYTSWNGATDITGYDVYAGATADTLSMIGNVPRTGFETEIALNSLPDDTCFFQTRPVHDMGGPTPFSNLVYRLDLPVCWEQLSHTYLPITINP